MRWIGAGRGAGGGVGRRPGPFVRPWEEDDELLGVRGEFERLAEQLKLMPAGWFEPENSASRHYVALQTRVKSGPRDGGEFGGGATRSSRRMVRATGRRPARPRCRPSR